VPTRELEGGLERGEPSGPETAGAEGFFRIGRQQIAQAAMFAKQCSSEFERIGASRAGAEEQCDQLRIRERRGATLE
jgi:hypothetical protein